MPQNSKRMNSEYEKQLEAEVNRNLRGLPVLHAPRTLIPRVLTAIRNPVSLPWYRQSWPMWPAAMRVASLIILIGLFGALCFAGWKAPQGAEFVAAMHRVGDWCSSAGAVWSALNSLAGALVLVAKHLGTGFLIACFVALGLGYGVSVGMVTVYVRLAFARR